jgi:hypothetical protein
MTMKKKKKETEARSVTHAPSTPNMTKQTTTKAPTNKWQSLVGWQQWRQHMNKKIKEDS